jgi:hypothetical protein
MVRRVFVALTLVGLGWAAALAQAPPTPDFEVSVSATRSGQITIECVRGCGLQFGRETAERARAKKTFTYGPCAGTWTTCNAHLHGWLVP